MSHPDDYVSVTAVLMERRDKSVRLETPAGFAWLPRGWVEKGDDNRLNTAEVGAPVTLRVLGDRAAEKGLV